MTKSKLGRALLTACVFSLGHSAAFAQVKTTDADNKNAERDQYIKTMTALCPNCTKALQGVAADYKLKCGVEPTMAQIKEITAGNSPAYVFRLASITLDKGNDVTAWTPGDQAKYKGFIDGMDCPAKKPR